MTLTLPPGTSFGDIPQLPRARYTVDVEWRDLERYLARQQKELGLDLDPDFQRGHVWSEAQQTAYVEYILQGGENARVLLAGAVAWEAYPPKAYVLLDGKQRLEAVRRFHRGEIRAFGRLFGEFTGRTRCVHGFQWRVIDTTSRVDMLAAYLTFNGGGIAHSAEELARVRKLLDEARGKGQ